MPALTSQLSQPEKAKKLSKAIIDLVGVLNNASQRADMPRIAEVSAFQGDARQMEDMRWADVMKPARKKKRK